MKYAIISDIHGNMPALRLVLDDAKAQGAEGFILGGDYTIRAPWFNEAICTLRSLPNSYAVRGNEEVYLHMQPGDDAQFAICYWVNRVIEPENLAWLDNLPERLDLVLNGAPVHIAHQPDVFLGREIGDIRFLAVILQKFQNIQFRHYISTLIRSPLQGTVI